MGKSIAIKLAILLVVASLAYSVFWFFKVGQVEKQINKFVSDNSSYISAGEVAVSGFPLSQKITIKNLKFSIPNAALDKNDITVSHLEATAGIMDSNYKINLIDSVTIQDADGNVSNVEFAQNPEINASIAGGNITGFHYQDSGYKIVGQDKAVSYSASSTMVSIKSNFELDKITHNISANVSEIEGFGVIDLYKNVLEKRVIDGIKTNEITLGNVAPAAAPATIDPTQTAQTSTPATNAPAATIAATTNSPVVTPAIPATPAAATNSNTNNVAAAPTSITPATTTPTTPDASATTNVATTSTVQNSPNAAPTANSPAPTADAQAPNTTASIPAAETVASIKSSLTLDLEYTLTPAQAAGQQANTPPDPTQIVEAPSQYNKATKISSLEFSNPLYKISVNGEMSALTDDNLPSGGITIKVEKVDALISQLSSDLTQMAQKLKPAPAAEAKPVVAADPATAVVAAPTPAPAPIEDPYQVFLTRISAGLNSVSKEIAAKNAASKDQISQFDLRREKNLDFLINETPMHEVLGKF